MSFSLRWMFVWIAIAAVFAAGFGNRTAMWVAVVFQMTVGILTIATIYGILSSRSRPFWLSFSVVGWVHFIANAFPLSPHSPSSKLFTRQFSHDLWYRDLFYLFHDGGNSTFLQAAALVEITQDMFALLISVLAGVIASYCVRRSKSMEHS